MRLHVVHHFLTHEGGVVALGHCLRAGLLVDDIAVVIEHDVAVGVLLGNVEGRRLILIVAHAGLGVGLSLPGFVEQRGHKLLLFLLLGNIVHAFQSLAFSCFGKLKLELGKHQLKAGGRPEIRGSHG